MTAFHPLRSMNPTDDGDHLVSGSLSTVSHQSGGRKVFHEGGCRRSTAAAVQSRDEKVQQWHGRT